MGDFLEAALQPTFLLPSCKHVSQGSVLEPNEFHLEEVQNGPPVRVSCTFRLSLPMDTHLQHIAWSSKCDKSTVIRQALHEYFANRGINAWV